MITFTRRSVSRNVSLPENLLYFGDGLIGWRISSSPHIWRPPTDLIETEDAFIVRVEIAGMSESNFAITLDQNMLSIRGIRPEQTEKVIYHQMEINHGEFRSEIEFFTPINPETSTAVYQDGFLIMQLPKMPPVQVNITKDNE